MIRYILNRIIYLIPTLFIMSLVVFSFVHLIPGDPVDAILGLNASEEARQAVREELGLDRNVLVQYLSWASGIVLLIFLLVIIAGPSVTGYKYDKMDIRSRFQGPSWAHLMGTDNYGRDTLARVIHGARVSF